VRRLAWKDVGERAIRYVDTKRHRVRYTPLLGPLADDLREWFLASGRPDGNQPVLPAHDGGFWGDDDWRNWRRRVWHGEPERTLTRGRITPRRRGCAPSGIRPRDLWSSFVTLPVYEGVPLTQFAREVGTSVRMIEQHYAGVIANWDGNLVPADQHIPAKPLEPSRGLEPRTPSLPSRSLGCDNPCLPGIRGADVSRDGVIFAGFGTFSGHGFVRRGHRAAVGGRSRGPCRSCAAAGDRSRGGVGLQRATLHRTPKLWLPPSRRRQALLS
jgi:hypothetical protein